MKIVAVSALFTSLLGAPAPAAPVTDRCEALLEEAVAQQLRDLPGGVVTEPGVISYDGGDTVVTITVRGCPRDFTIPCATAAFCMWTDRLQNVVRVEKKRPGRHDLFLPGGFHYYANNREFIAKVTKTNGRTICLKKHATGGSPNVMITNWKSVTLSATARSC